MSIPLALAKTRQLRTIPAPACRWTPRLPWELSIVQETSDIMTIEQLAGYLKISRSTLYKLAQDGKLSGQGRQALAVP